MCPSNFPLPSHLMHTVLHVFLIPFSSDWLIWVHTWFILYVHRLDCDFFSSSLFRIFTVLPQRTFLSLFILDRIFFEMSPSYISRNRDLSFTRKTRNCKDRNNFSKYLSHKNTTCRETRNNHSSDSVGNNG